MSEEQRSALVVELSADLGLQKELKGAAGFEEVVAIFSAGGLK
jgi:hypothetical protein